MLVKVYVDTENCFRSTLTDETLRRANPTERSRLRSKGLTGGTFVFDDSFIKKRCPKLWAIHSEGTSDESGNPLPKY